LTRENVELGVRPSLAQRAACALRARSELKLAAKWAAESRA
jgi:hypothetical protein